MLEKFHESRISYKTTKNKNHILGYFKLFQVSNKKLEKNGNEILIQYTSIIEGCLKSLY